MSWRISIVELPDGEILIDGKPTDFAPPWKTEDAIRQQARDIAELRNELADALDVRLRMSGAPTALGMVAAERDQLRADLAAAVAARDWQIQATKAAIESCNQATTAGLAAVAERDQLRARLAAIEAAPVVVRDTEIARLEAEVERSRHTLMVETERLRNENDRIAAEHESSVEIRDTEIARLQTDLELSREEMAAQVEAAYREGQSDFRHGSGITNIDWRNSVSRKQLEAK